MTEYEDKLEQQARQCAAKVPLSFEEIRELLILSAATCCHTAHVYFDSRLSDPELLDYLFSTIDDADGFFSGDARMQAAYYLGRFDPVLLSIHSDDLLSLYDAENGEGAGGCLRGLLSRALAAAHVRSGRERILADTNPERTDNWLFMDALRAYDQIT